MRHRLCVQHGVSPALHHSATWQLVHSEAQCRLETMTANYRAYSSPYSNMEILFDIVMVLAFQYVQCQCWLESSTHPLTVVSNGLHCKEQGSIATTGRREIRVKCCSIRTPRKRAGFQELRDKLKKKVRLDITKSKIQKLSSDSRVVSCGKWNLYHLMHLCYTRKCCSSYSTNIH